MLNDYMMGLAGEEAHHDRYAMEEDATMDEAEGSPLSTFDPFVSHMTSHVFMSEDGAEVTLLPSISETECSPSSSRGEDYDRFETVVLTPDTETERRFIISNLPTHSLMDNDVTPSPMTPDKNHSRMMNIWCTGQNLGCYKCDDHENVTIANKSMEHTINNLLGSPMALDDWCTSWQAWTYYELNRDQSEESCMGLKNDMKRVLRNRAGNMRARSIHFSRLKHNLNPFDVTPERNSIPLTKTASYCVSEQHRGRLAQPQETEMMLSSVIAACSAPNKEDSPFVIRSRGLQDDLFYDSDPEETTKRQSPRKASRHPTTRRPSFWNQFYKEEESDSVEIDRSLDVLDLNDSSMVREYLQEIMNQRFTLVWHLCAADEGPSKPVAVVAWIERGQHLHNKLIQPRLVWRKLRSASTPSKRGLSDFENHHVDLLDISRIIEVSRIDRKRYPLAQKKQSLHIQCLDGQMLFEASSEMERDRLCRDLKLVVARLGSKIILEDETLFDEFFVVDTPVPGEAPHWAKANY
jgi:hypothetical protein